MPAAINLAQKLQTFSQAFSPKTVALVNGHDVMVVKAAGALDWHVHPDTDDFFLVIQGELRLETDQGDVCLKAGEMYVVPKGVRHRPVAEKECHILLIEPTGTPNTGDPATAAVREII